MSEFSRSKSARNTSGLVAVALSLGSCTGVALASQEQVNNDSPTPTTITVEVGCPPVPGSTYQEDVILDGNCNPIDTVTASVLTIATLPASL